MSKNILLDEEDGDVEVVVKKEKKKKSSEERGRDRKVVFWVLFFVLFATFLFWLKANLFDVYKIPNQPDDDYMVEDSERETKDKKDGFYIKYKI